MPYQPVLDVSTPADVPAGGAPRQMLNQGDATLGAVTQITSTTTGVTLNKLAGQITTFAQSVAAAGEVDFVVTNSLVRAGDVVLVCIGTHTSAGSFIATVVAVAAGSFTIRLTNLHASAAGDALLVINFVVVQTPR